jgi:hypothetical protein
VTEISIENGYLPASEGVRLVGIGLKALIAVALPDAILVAPRAAAQEVGRAVAVMKAKGILHAAKFPKEHRPWGGLEKLTLGDRFQAKRIVVKPGGRLSLQSHNRRGEHWMVVESAVYVTISGRSDVWGGTRASMYRSKHSTSWRTKVARMLC